MTSHKYKPSPGRGRAVWQIKWSPCCSLVPGNNPGSRTLQLHLTAPYISLPGLRYLVIRIILLLMSKSRAPTHPEQLLWLRSLSPRHRPSLVLTRPDLSSPLHLLWYAYITYLGYRGETSICCAVLRILAEPIVYPHFADTYLPPSICLPAYLSVCMKQAALPFLCVPVVPHRGCENYGSRLPHYCAHKVIYAVEDPVGKGSELLNRQVVCALDQGPHMTIGLPVPNKNLKTHQDRTFVPFYIIHTVILLNFATLYKSTYCIYILVHSLHISHHKWWQVTFWYCMSAGGNIYMGQHVHASLS